MRVFGSDQHFDVARFHALDAKYIWEIAGEYSQKIRSAKPLDSPWSFIANSDMSGLPASCSADACRQANLRETAALAALYADHVVLFDPIQSAVEEFYNGSRMTKGLASELLKAIRQIEYLDPLIHRGLVSFTQFTPKRVCDDCLERTIREMSGKHVSSPSAAVYSTLLEEAEVTVESVAGGSVRTVEALVPSFAHASIFSLPRKHDKLLSRPVGYRLSPEEVHHLGIFRSISDYLGAEIVAKNTLLAELPTVGAFSSGLEGRALRRIFGSDFVDQVFDASLPLSSALSINDLLSLRESEWHQFETYRQLFFEFISNAQGSAEDLERQWSRDIFPEYCKIERTVETHRRRAIGRIVDHSAITVVSIGASWLAAGASSLLATAAAVIGGGHFARSMVPAVRQAFSEPLEVRDSKLYFAWKVRRRVRHN